MRVMSAGQGYRYLLKSVAAADGNRDLATPLTDYYTADGTPPGRWLGSGVHQLGDGQIHPRDVVTEEQLQQLLGQGRDPVTGDPLGHAYPDYKDREERIQARIAPLDPGLSADARAAAIAKIQTDEGDTKTRRAVAGFDYTFSVPKSVSVLWAIAEEPTRAQIVAAHHAAITDVVGLMEREVAATRSGIAGPDGAVAQVAVAGLIATAFDHYDSRAGDPQLHTHLVVSNKVKTVFDGKWRSLDGRPMHAAVVALSELYNGLLADHLTQTLGVSWQARDRGRDRNPAWEISGIPDTLVETFSSRSHAIEVETNRLIADYRTHHGREPTATTIIKLRAQATLATRPDKTVRSLAELTTGWQAQARDVLGEDVTTWAARLLSSTRGQSMIHTADLSSESLVALGRRVVEVVGERRSTWRRWNLHAEVSRQIMGWRFATTTDRQTVLGLIVDAAEHASLRLTPPELASSPPEFQRTDSSSVFRPKHSTVYTSAELLAAEDRLLDLARTTTGPTVPAVTIQVVGRHDDAGRVLGADQLAALAAVAGSGRTVDVLVGPAGAGKTTALNALHRAWETHHGAGSVVGLAPSAAAAQILADELDIVTDNTAKWLYDHTNTGTGFRQGQLVIIDESSLAGTHTLDRISGHAGQVGAKVLLVGDWAQLAAVEAGGAFGMLVRDRTNPPELTDVRRFHHHWEQDASLQLRHGDPGVIDTYQAHGRIRDGDTDIMIDTAYQAWQVDLAAGRSSVMIAQTRDTVTALNSRARHDRILTGHVAPAGAVSLHDGTDASAGDLVLTRRNNRRLSAGKGWVKNGDRWIITATHHDGSIDIRRTSHPSTSLRLPANYVANHVELAYAVTAHRAQGATVDTAHTLIQPGMTRETLYVAMTRGRHTNTAYVATDQPDTEPHHRDEATGRSVLAGVLQHVGAEHSAHETLTAQHHAAASIAQLAAEYETIAAAAQHHRWSTLIRQSGLTPEQADAVINSDAFGPLTAEVRRAEANHHDPDTLLPRLIAARRLDDADDIAAILHHRVETVTSRRTGTTRPRPAPRLIVGLIPEATGPMTPGMRYALDERKHLIEQRAHDLTYDAIATQAPWTRKLGHPPGDPHRRQVWARHVQTVAAYRDRYQINANTLLGAPPPTQAQRIDAARARSAMMRAQRLTTVNRPKPTSHVLRRDSRSAGPTL